MPGFADSEAETNWLLFHQSTLYSAIIRIPNKYLDYKCLDLFYIIKRGFFLDKMSGIVIGTNLHMMKQLLPAL